MNFIMTANEQFHVVQDNPREGWGLMLGPIEVIYLSSSHMTQKVGTEFMERLANKLNGVLGIMRLGTFD